jgi:hypothetical protein
MSEDSGCYFLAYCPVFNPKSGLVCRWNQIGSIFGGGLTPTVVIMTIAKMENK